MPAQHRRHVLLALFLTLSAGLGCALLVERNGWAAPSSLSSPAGAAHMVDAFEAVSGPQPGFRRNHAKGLCVSGRFDSNGQGVALANTGLLRTGSYPVTGRFSVVGGNPSVNDTQGGMRSLALDISNGGETWRMALNSSPVFFVRTPEALLEQLQASVPTDGREARIRHFRRDHPESQAFEDWMAAHRPSTGFDNAAYFSVNTFRFNAADGQEHLVRWHLQPETPYAPLSDEQIAQNDPDMLSYGLASRLAEGPLRWHLILTPALPGDPVNDATQLWTQPGHQEIDAGVLVIDAQQPQMDGPCRDIDFNPLILPPGITPSDDPLLQARGAAYAESHRRRMREMAGQ
ncbi:catalase family peroxidase [Pseudomonas sp. A014]|uniref:catalase family peroxidase n=1 Tax=Pseudomonas sp. A014 TaxID=3458058 RepID=UPI004036E8A9